MKINVKKCHPNAMLPHYGTPGAVGCDVLAVEECVLFPGQRSAVRTGLIFEIPDEYEIQIRPRSGQAINFGLTVLNTPGTIDPDYRGEVKVILVNLGKEATRIAPGQKIAQLIVAPVTRAQFVEVTGDLTATERGTNGFGSTDKLPTKPLRLPNRAPRPE